MRACPRVVSRSLVGRRPALGAALASLTLLVLVGPVSAAPAVVPLGDVDASGVVSVRDAVLARAPFLLAGVDLFELDCDRNAVVNAADLDCIERRILLLPPSLAVDANAGDLALLAGTNLDGAMLVVLGDTSGVTGTQVVGTGGKLTTATVDSDGQAAALSSPTGGTSKLSWPTSTDVVASSTSADGSTQVVVGVDLAATGKLPAAAALPAGAPRAPSSNPPCGATRTTEGGDPDALLVELAELPALLVTPAQAVAVLPNQVVLALTRCAAWVDDATTWLTVSPEGGTPYVVPGVSLGEGNHVFTLPSPPSASDPTPEETCAAADASLTAACAVLASALAPAREDLCTAVAAAALLGGDADAAASLLADCIEGIGALEITCEVAGFAFTADGPTLLSSTCDDIGDATFDRFTADDLTLQAHVVLPGLGAFATAPLVAAGAGPFPPLALDASGPVAILEVTLDPSDPQPFEDYIVTTRISCGAPSTKVRITVIGSDGYVSSVRYPAKGDVLLPVCVPGRDSGIMDTITIQVEGGPARKLMVGF